MQPNYGQHKPIIINKFEKIIFSKTFEKEGGRRTRNESIYNEISGKFLCDVLEENMCQQVIISFFEKLSHYQIYQ